MGLTLGLARLGCRCEYRGPSVESILRLERGMQVGSVLYICVGLYACVCVYVLCMYMYI